MLDEVGARNAACRIASTVASVTGSFVYLRTLTRLRSTSIVSLVNGRCCLPDPSIMPVSRSTQMPIAF